MKPSVSKAVLHKAVHMKRWLSRYQSSLYVLFISHKSGIWCLYTDSSFLYGPTLFSVYRKQLAYWLTRANGKARVKSRI